MNTDQRITLDTYVADLLKEWPQVIPIFLQHHMSCVGCSMSVFETLGDAARIYGMVPRIFLGELCQVIDPSIRNHKLEI